jgi:hypothetical protein
LGKRKRNKRKGNKKKRNKWMIRLARGVATFGTRPIRRSAARYRRGRDNLQKRHADRRTVDLQAVPVEATFHAQTPIRRDGNEKARRPKDRFIHRSGETG